MPLIWVTGAEGQVGYLLQRFISKHYLWSVRFFTRLEFDLTNENRMASWLQHEIPCCVINLAAYTMVDQAETDAEKALSVNAIGVATLAKLCANQGVPIIHVSTDYVFSGLSTQPYQSTDITDPQSVYGHSKEQGETYLRLYQPAHVILRTSWVFSARSGSFVTKITRKGFENRKVSVVSDQIGCPTFAQNLACVLCKITESIINGSATYGTYHYCDDTTYSWFSFTQRIFELIKQQDEEWQNIKVLPVFSVDYPTPAIRPKYSVLSVDKLTRDYGISPMSCDVALQKVVQQVLEQATYV